MFIYAAARALAHRRGARLLLDLHSGFQQDYYQRRASLHHFALEIEPASRWARRWFSFRLLRQWARRRSRLDEAGTPAYCVDPEDRFVQKVFDHPVTGSTYLDGYWQSEKYFTDAAPVIRADFAIKSPLSEETRRLGAEIDACDAICVHARRLHGRPAGSTTPLATHPQVDMSYYEKAIDELSQSMAGPRIFCFSDQPDFFREHLRPRIPVTFVTHNTGDERSYEDLWLMTRCRHFVLANSSFSWWGAWLSARPGKRVIYPQPVSWEWVRNSDMMPATWEGRPA